jgi:hypothetical protein
MVLSLELLLVAVVFRNFLHLQCFGIDLGLMDGQALRINFVLVQIYLPLVVELDRGDHLLSNYLHQTLLFPVHSWVQLLQLIQVHIYLHSIRILTRLLLVIQLLKSHRSGGSFPIINHIENLVLIKNKNNNNNNNLQDHYRLFGRHSRQGWTQPSPEIGNRQ